MNSEAVFLRSKILKLLIRMGLTDIILDLYWGRNSLSQWQEIEKSGFIDEPRSLWFEPTMRCNLACIFCHQNERRKNLLDEINLSAIGRLFDNAKKIGINRIEMIGGEIFLRDDIFKILDLIEEKSMKVKLGTNAYLLNAVSIERLNSYSCIRSIAVSIDGPQEIHNRLRNSELSFQRAAEALSLLSGNRYLTVLYMVLLKENTAAVEFMINLAQKIKPDRITFLPQMSYSEKDIEAARKYLNMDANEKIFVSVSDAFSEDEYIKNMVQAIADIKKIRRKKAVFAPIFPKAAGKYPYKFFSGHYRKEKRLICKHFHSLTVIENGDVYLCPFIQKRVGNVLEERIEDIWNNEIIRNLRRRVLGANLLSICSRCCSADYL